MRPPPALPAVTVLTAVLLALPAAIARPPGLANGGFEEGRAGDAPPGWIVPPVVRQSGWAAKTTDERPKEGKACVRLRRAAIGGEMGFGNLMQAVDGALLRGKRIRVAASVRVEGHGARAQLWVRVDRASGQPGFFDNMGDRPVTSSRWKDVEIVGSVDEDATAVNVGLMAFGSGTAWLDAVSLEVLGKAPPPYRPVGPRPLEGRALANVVAFARLYGYVRHFHPSDEAAAAAWEGILVGALPRVEAADDDAALARVLQETFRPVAPTAWVGSPSRKPDAHAELVRPSGPGSFTVRGWHHLGLGPEAGPAGSGIYRSLRLQIPLPPEGLPEEVADPRDPLHVDLGGSVACSVPLALYADREGTLPRAEGTPPAPPDGYVASGDDRTTRLAAVIVAWNVFQHFYPYFDLVGTDWAAELPRALAAAAEDPDARAFLGTLRRMVAALHDGHGFVAHASGVNAGRLPLLWDWIEGALVVTAVAEGLEGGPGPGDVVTAIDGKPAGEAIAAAEAFVSGATPQWIRRRALEELAQSPTLEPRPLRIRSLADDDQERTVRLTPVGGAFPDLERRPAKVAELEPGIWYVDIDRVTDADLAAAMGDLAKAKGVVFDFRGYPKGDFQAWIPHLLREPATSARFLVPFVTLPDRADMTFPPNPGWQVAPKEPCLSGKRAFVTDGRAVSYAESCLGIVENYRLGEIVGGPTAGTNGNVNPISLPGGYRVAWTGMRVEKHDGTPHHGVGILPTIPCERTRAGVAAGKDELLQRAIEAVR